MINSHAKETGMDLTIKTILAAAAVVAAPLLAPQPAAASTIYPWCLYDTRGGVNCGFVSERQCRVSKTANADMCGLNGLYFRYPVRYTDVPAYAPPKRYRYRR
jgi:hypothetical protein